MRHAEPATTPPELRSLRLFARLHGGARDSSAPPSSAAHAEAGGEASAAQPRRIRIEDWFDPDDDGHLLAFERFRETGVWPEGFLPSAVDLSPAWDSQVAFRLAEKWMRHRAAVRLRAEGVE